MENKKRMRKATIVFLSIACVFVILLLITLFINKDALNGALSNISQSTKLILLIFTFLLIILFIYLIIYAIRMIKTNKQSQNDSIAIKKVDAEKNINDQENTRFYQLSKIDKDATLNGYNDFDDSITLKEMCEDFRNFSASKLHLYYDIEDIRKFISSLAISKLIIIQGISGTGKTSLAYAFGEYLNNSSTIIPIQPMWKERSDLIGYYNEFTNHFNETSLLRKMYEANYNNKIYITVLDEMNIARVEYYFAEFISLLELPNSEARYLDVINDSWPTDPKLLVNGQIKLPSNMWFIGTANNDDSTFAISDKVYDRAMILNLEKKTQKFNPVKTNFREISYDYFSNLSDNAKLEYRISERNKLRINELDTYLIRYFNITFGNRIMKQLNEYVSLYICCGGEENVAIDDFIAKKILRKMDSLNPVIIKQNIPSFIKFLDELFGKNTMMECKRYLNKFA